MRVNMMVDPKLLPRNGMSLITAEMEKRLLPRFPDAHIRVRKGSSTHLDISCKVKGEKEVVNKIIETMFDEADEWLITEFR